MGIADEYINRGDAIDAITAESLERNLDRIMTDDASRYHRAAARVLAGIPAADVRPVVRGKWTLFARRGIYGVMYECSACHAKYDGITNFCPNCGADMRKES